MGNIVLLLTLAACSHHSVCVGGSLRILNGRPALNDEFPFVISIERITSAKPPLAIYRMCSGSLILTNWVLTAAHCFGFNNPIIRYCNMTMKRNNLDCLSKVLKIVPHPNYRKYPAVWNDIGLILIEKVNTNYLARLSALDFRTLMGFAVDFAGFGLTRPLGEWEDAELDMLSPLQIGSGVVCNCPTDVGSEWIHKICVRPRCSQKLHGPYLSDSGGPLIFNGHVVAVISGGQAGTLTILTPVSPYLGWIRQSLNLN